MSKTCTKCGTTKPLTSEFYPRRKDSKDGFRNSCKECEKVRMKKWNEENKEHIAKYNEENKEKIREYQREYDKKYYKKHREFKLQYKKEHYKNNKDKYYQWNKQWRERNSNYYSIRQKEHRERNKDSLKEYGKQYRKENKEYLNEMTRTWRQKNRHIDAMYSRNRQRDINSLEVTLTQEEWNDTLRYFDYKCAYCGISQSEHRKETGQRLHQDHLIPLTREGGFTHDNIIPSCRRCNSCKNNSEFLTWYRGFEDYSVDRENKIFKFIEKNGGVENDNFKKQ